MEQVLLSLAAFPIPIAPGLGVTFDDAAAKGHVMDTGKTRIGSGVMGIYELVVGKRVRACPMLGRSGVGHA